MTGSILGAVGVGVIGALAVLVGGGIPDTDSRSSIPRRHLDNILRFLGVVIVIVGTVVYWDAIMSSVASAMPSVDPRHVVLGGVLVAVLAVPTVLQRGADTVIPSHRGLFHNLGVWAVATAVPVGVVYLGLVSIPGVPEDVQKVGSLVIGGLFLLGVAGHLYQDGEL